MADDLDFSRWFLSHWRNETIVLCCRDRNLNMHLRREKPHDLIYMRLQVEPPNDFIHKYIKYSFKLNQPGDNAIIFNRSFKLSRSIVTSTISKAIFVLFSVTCPTTCWWPWPTAPLISCPTWRNSTWTTTTFWTSRTTCLVTYVGLRFCKYDQSPRKSSYAKSLQDATSVYWTYFPSLNFPTKYWTNQPLSVKS